LLIVPPIVFVVREMSHLQEQIANIQNEIRQKDAVIQTLTQMTLKHQLFTQGGTPASEIVRNFALLQQFFFPFALDGVSKLTSQGCGQPNNSEEFGIRAHQITL
jgi:hypothetical protein